MKNIFSYDEISGADLSMPEIVLRGNRRIEIENVEEILCLEEGCVKLCLGRISVTVCGDCLKVGTLGAHRITLTGNILSVSFFS